MKKVFAVAKVAAIVNVFLFFTLFITTCGGGAAGGAGGASIPDSEYSTHNPGGWGGGGAGGPGVNTTGGTPIIVERYEDPVTGTFAGSQLNDLIAAIQNNSSRSNSVFYVPFYVVGDPVVRQARVTKANTKVEKFEHQYKVTFIIPGGTPTVVYYYKDDGIDLASMTAPTMNGWLGSNGVTYTGSSITGISGDLTLTAVYQIALTTSTTEISKPSSLITSLGITQDSEGTPVKPSQAQLTVAGSTNYTYSYDSSKISINDATGVVTIASSYDPSFTGESVTITATDDDDSSATTSITITICKQCVLALYANRTSYLNGGSADYTKLLSGQSSMNVSPYSLVSSAWASLGPIDHWREVAPTVTNINTNDSITVSQDTQLYAAFNTMNIAPTAIEISKPSTLLASLNITQDSAGTAVKPASTHLNVVGSDSWNYTYDSSKITIDTTTNDVTVASGYNPAWGGETVTITATDANDSGISAQTTITITKQAVCVLYKSKTSCDNNGTPRYTKLLSGQSSMSVSPHALTGSAWETADSNTITKWRQMTPTVQDVANSGSVTVTGDTKIYAVYNMTLQCNQTEIAKHSTLITSLNLTQDSAGTQVKPASAQLTVSGCTNYSFTTSVDGAFDITPAGVVTVASGVSGSGNITITATDNDDPIRTATCTLPFNTQYVLALYQNKASYNNNPNTPSYTKIYSWGDSSSMNVSPLSLVGSTWEASLGTIHHWRIAMPTPETNLARDGSRSINADTKMYATYGMSLSTVGNVNEISKKSPLLASLGITQDSSGTAVKPATLTLSVEGSDNYSFASSPSNMINISGTGVVSIKDSITPDAAGESITITVTDNADSALTAQTTITISSQYVCALYVDKATSESGTPGWKKILSGSGTVSVSPYSTYGANFESQHGGTISGWRSSGGSLINKNDSVSVSVEDTKIYAGWAPQVSTTSITLYRFSGNDANLSAQLTIPTNAVFSISGADGGISWSGSNPTFTITVDESHNFGTNNGIYTGAKILVYITGQEESSIEIPITVKDCMYVDGSGVLKKMTGSGVPTITIPENYTIPASVGGRTVTGIDEQAFWINTTIKKLTIPAGIEIGQEAFYGCTALEEVTLGNGVIVSGYNAFAHCEALKKVTIGDNVVFNGPLVFCFCSNLETIIWGTGVTFTDDASFTFENTKIQNCSFPNNFTEIPFGIFRECENLGTITIPSSVTKICSYAFYETTFQKIEMPISVAEIDSFAFTGATGTIDYAGTIDDWKNVSRATGFSNANNVTVHCTNGECPYWEGMTVD